MALFTQQQDASEGETNNTFSKWLSQSVLLNWELIAWLIIFALAIFTRFYMLGDRTMSHDESLHTVFSNNLAERGDFKHNPMMHGPILFHATALSYQLFGTSDFSARVYPALLGIMMVMFPVLMRPWFGRTGAILAGIMILASPLLLYYHRYIREDTPAILATIIMFYATIMYTNGPPKQRGKAHWLYILAAANLWNLGSKETGFFYVAIFGAFLTLYLIVRLIQYYTNINGRLVFQSVTLSILIAGTLSILLIMVLSISMFPYKTLDDRLLYWGEQITATLRFEPISTDFSTFLVWSGAAIVSMLAVVIGAGIWAYRRGDKAPEYLIVLDIIAVIFAIASFFIISHNLSMIKAVDGRGEEIIVNMASAAMSLGWIVAMSFGLVYAALRFRLVSSFSRLAVALLAVAAIVLAGLIVVEELSHVPSRARTEDVAVPAEPGMDEISIQTDREFSVTPIVWTWVISAGVILFVINTKVAGWWRFLRKFPEFDVCMVLGALTLPWLAAIILSLTHSTTPDWLEIGASARWLGELFPIGGLTENQIFIRTGQFVIGFISWFPLMAVSIVGGLAWNWRRYLLASLVFYLLFLFFYTTMFTNPEGIASGLVYSLQYWMEQQGEKRGNQPQYYYTLVIMPFYEFLPIIGSMLAMVAGFVFFWRKNREKEEKLNNRSYPGGMLFGALLAIELFVAVWIVARLRYFDAGAGAIDRTIGIAIILLLTMMVLLVAWLTWRLWLEWSRRSRLAISILMDIPTALFNAFFVLTGVVIAIRHVMIMAGAPPGGAVNYDTYQFVYTLLTVLFIPLIGISLFMLVFWVVMLRRVWFIKEILHQQALEVPIASEDESLPSISSLLSETTEETETNGTVNWLMRELGYVARWLYMQIRRPIWWLMGLSVALTYLVVTIIENHFFLLDQVPSNQYIIFTIPNLPNGGVVLGYVLGSFALLFSILMAGLLWVLLGYELAPQNASYATSIRKNWARLTRLYPRVAWLLPRPTTSEEDTNETPDLGEFLPKENLRWWSNIFDSQLLSMAFGGLVSLLIGAIAFYLLFWDTLYLGVMAWEGRAIAPPEVDFAHIMRIVGFILQIVGLIIIPLVIGTFALYVAYNLFAWVWSALAVKSPEFGDVTHREETPTDLGAFSETTESSLSNSWKLTEVPVLLFISWWAVFNLLAYTLAGEKMPWLGTHMSVPMIFLTAWYFGRVFDRIEWQKFAQQGWLYLFIFPLMMLALFRMVMPLMVGEVPFVGLTQTQLNHTFNWLGAFVLFAGGLYIAIVLARRIGWQVFRQMLAVTAFSLLAILTFRSGWIASFINYDLPTEFLVYAHGGPANKFVTEQLADLSMRATGGMGLRIMHDNRFSWPGSWYLRDFTNVQYIDTRAPTPEELSNTMVVIVGDSNNARVEPLVRDNYQKFTYKRMWWPYQNIYWDLNATKINDWLSFRDANAAQRRRGWFDIWWARDYSAYERAIHVPNNPFNTDFDLTTWPVSDTMYVYIRKDIAAQVWLYGVGDGSPLSQFTELQVNICNENFVEREAIFAFQNQVQPLTRPLGLAVASDGRVIVAEESEPVSQISIFAADGTLLNVYGQPGSALSAGAFFNRPHSVGIAPNGVIYVADTWNYRIRAFDSHFNQLTMWGQPYTLGADAQREPVDGLWGPREVKVDNNGLVYVADTGNRRIRVYTPDGVWVRDIGRSGAGDGQLDEPAGFALHPDGRIFIADTRNNRIAVFFTDGTFIRNFPVRGWYEDFGSRPYVALDAARDLLYVTDPDASRILMYDTNGNCIGSFGSPVQSGISLTQFGTLGGIATDSQGNLYVSDMTYGRVVKFAPYERPGVIPQVDFGELVPPIEIEVTPEVTPLIEVILPEETAVVEEMTAETTPEG